MDNTSMYLYDLQITRICDLYNNDGTSPRNVKIDKKINEITGLSFDISFLNPYVDEISCGMLVEFESQVFEVFSLTKQHNDDDSIVISVSCFHYSSSLKNKQVLEKEVDPATGTNALKGVLYEIDGTTPKYGWTIGTVDVDAIYRGYDIKEQSVFETLIQIAELFEAHIVFSSTISGTSLINTVGMRKINNFGSLEPLRIDVNKNLKNVEISYDFSEFVTRLYCFGGTNPVTELDVDLLTAQVNGDDYGLTYIENYSYYLAQGYSQAYINANPNKFLKEGVWRDNNYVDATMLYTDAVKKLATLATPKLNITFSSVRFDPDYYGFSTVDLGYPIIINDEDLGIAVQCLATGISRNYETSWLYDFEISNIVEYKSYIGQLFRTSNNIQTTTNENGTVKPEAIGAVTYPIKQDIKDIIDYTFVGSVIADGILADNIKAGTLESFDGSNYINLDNGNFNFGKDANNYFRYSGTDFLFKGNIDATSGTIGGWTINSNTILTESSKNIIKPTGWEDGSLIWSTGLETTDATKKRSNYISLDLDPVIDNVGTSFTIFADAGQKWRIYKYSNRIVYGEYEFLRTYPTTNTWITGTYPTEQSFPIESDVYYIRVVYDTGYTSPTLVIPQRTKTILSSISGLEIITNRIPTLRITEDGSLVYKTPPLVFGDLSLDSNYWANYAGTYFNGIQYSIDNNTTIVRGVIVTTSLNIPANTVIATLPVSARPNRNMIFPAMMNNGFMPIEIYKNGQIKNRVATGAIGSYISLDGIRYEINT